MRVCQYPRDQVQFDVRHACLKQAFFFDRNFSIVATTAGAVPLSAIPQSPVQVRQRARPGRHGVVHKPLLIFLESRHMIAAFWRFIMRNEDALLCIMKMHFNAPSPEIRTYFTCYWHVKPPPRAWQPAVRAFGALLGAGADKPAALLPGPRDPEPRRAPRGLQATPCRMAHPLEAAPAWPKRLS